MIIKGEAGKIEINILKRSNSETEDIWDGNWLEAEIKIQIRGFNCIYGTNLRVEDFQRFYENLIALNIRQIEEIEFVTMEEGLYLYFRADANGSIICRGRGKDDVDISIEFKFEIDAMAIEYLIGEVKIILNSYPQVGG